jgi:hypothetical protein
LFIREKRSLNIRRRIGVKICPCIKTPMMVGFVRPIVLLPSEDIPYDELGAILRHELVHFKRHDLYWKTLMMLALAVHWFNPIAHLLFRVACNLCETSCDEEVLKGADEKTRARYGEAIIGVIRGGGAYQTALSTNFFSSTKGIKKRVYAIMDISKKRFSPALLMIVLFASFCCVTAFAATPTQGFQGDTAAALGEQGEITATVNDPSPDENTGDNSADDAEAINAAAPADSETTDSTGTPEAANEDGLPTLVITVESNLTPPTSEVKEPQTAEPQLVVVPNE